MASHFDCGKVADKFFDTASRNIKDLSSKPCLATVLFKPKQNPASLKYRDLVARDAERAGCSVRSLEPGSEEELVSMIETLNGDDDVTGIMVFHPLNASSLTDEDVMDLIAPQKDVEGLHSINLGYLIKYKMFMNKEHSIKCVVPATAKAVVKTLQYYPEIMIEGAFVAIINNSMRVGKPLGLMMENLGATVVKCYDKTPLGVLEDNVRRADIIVTAVPDPSFRLDPSWIKSGAIVLDVSFQGNFDAKELEKNASFITVPDNRIGRVTRAMMFVNLGYCAQQRETSLKPSSRRLPV